MEAEKLKLENQLCFPLYACAKEIVRHYKPILESLDLTYTQYIVMLILWEYGSSNVRTIGEKMYLDSGTLTPLLRKLEAKGYITRRRLDNDERNLMIDLTPAGKELQQKAEKVPDDIAKCVNLSAQEATVLYKILYKLLDGMEKNERNN